MNPSFDKIVSFIRDIHDDNTGVIPLHAPVFYGNEKKYLNECIDSTFVSSVGEFVNRFEEDIAGYTGAKKAVACVNGTNALYLALKLAGVQQGDEVITQPLTFVATANAISYCGANPVFLDIDRDSMGLSPDSLKDFLENRTFIDKKTKRILNKITRRRISAVIPMHTFGHPCQISEISKICEYLNIPLIEDAAESLGSFYKDKHTGTFGLIGVLSFNGNKILTTGGGGMLLFKDEELAKKAKHLTTQAKVDHRWEYIHDETGYNYRLPNLNAALGLAQLEQLEDFLSKKRGLAERYQEFFKGTEVQFKFEPKNTRANYWLNTIMFQSKVQRDQFLKYSNDKKVMTRPAWQLMNKLKIFKDCQSDELVNAEYLAVRIVNLPSSVIKSL